MADEPFALSTIPAALPEEADFDAIHSAVRATVRGRWFLEEYAKRNRNADTGQLVTAIERIEGVIRGDIAQQAQQSMRIELLEMARAIAQTRAEVAEQPARTTEAVGQETDVTAAAARLREIAATMRGRGIEPSTSDKIEALASTILAATPLHDPDSSRAQKLGEVLHYLEHRIDRLLDSAANPELAHTQEAAQSEVPAAQPQEAAATAFTAPEPAPEALEPAAAEPTALEQAALEQAALEQAALEQAALEIVALWTEPAPAPAPETPKETEASSLPSPAMDAQATEHPADEQARIADEGSERVELDVEPLVVVPAGAAFAHAAAPEPVQEPAAEFAPLPLPTLAGQPAATSDDIVDENSEAQATADPSLIWAVQTPEPEAPEPPPEPTARREEIDIEPLTVLPLTVTHTEIAQEPAAAAELATEPAVHTAPAISDTSARESEAPATAAADTASAAPQAADIVAVVEPLASVPLPEPAPDDTPPVAVDTQVEFDLETLGILTGEPPPTPPPPAPPLESDLLSNAWETAITSEPAAPPAEAYATSPEAAAATDAAQSAPLPSMWEEPPAAAATATKAATDEEAPADFLLEPLPDTDAVATQPEVSPARSQDVAASDLEDELFEDEPEPVAASALAPPAPSAPIPAPVPATAATTPAAAAAAATAAAPAAVAVAAPAAVTAVRMAPKPMPRHAVGDPLAALKSMSDEERLALFT